ncbi:hypothetical protein HWV62_45190 [Athelia sp. TMB]|nr:hypothetical protein HWV62_45190 [Athelia sp. TMB]
MNGPDSPLVTRQIQYLSCRETYKDTTSLSINFAVSNLNSIMFATKTTTPAAPAVPSGKSSPAPGKASPVPSPAKAAPAKSHEDLHVKTSAESLIAAQLTRSVSSSSAVSTTMTAVEDTTFSSTSSTFKKETLIRRRTMTMPFVESCRRWELKGSILHLECLLADGHTWKETTFDLNSCIGNIDGQLTWDKKDFLKTSEHHKAHLEGAFLVARCQRAQSAAYVDSRLDLATRLRNDNGVIVLIAHNEKLSMMLTEVPWMKFRVVAEPDFSVFTTHPVMRETMTRIAETTVEHVTKQMASIIAVAIAEATVVVTASAMEHVSQSMEVMLSSIGGETVADIDHSASHAGHLHTLGKGHHISLAPGKQLTL